MVEGELKKLIRDVTMINKENPDVLAYSVILIDKIDEAKKDYYSIQPKSDSPIEIGYLRQKWFVKWFGEVAE